MKHVGLKVALIVRENNVTANSVMFSVLSDLQTYTYLLYY